MNEAALWEKTCGLLREDMNEVSYNTWIKTSMKPVKLRDDTFFIEAISDFVKKTVGSRYMMLIANAASQVAGRQLRVILATTQEMQKFVDEEDSAAVKPLPYGLNPRYTFETFIVGNANRFAHAASLAVAEAPGDAYNPLFIYGGVGLGKTHLMHAIGDYIRTQYPEMNLLYVNSENFTNELIAAIQANKNVEFRNRFRNVDVLMVDDIQFIAGRDATQEEFFHTFNTLHGSGKQIIITSDKPPKEIMRLEERLVSRFEWGLTTEIQRPDIETRIAILRKKAGDEEIQIGNEELSLIAGRIESNIRELEGALTRVVAYAELSGQAITPKLVEELLPSIRGQIRAITCEGIQQTVAEYYNITVQDLKAKKRSREVSVPRQVAMALTREMTELSLTQIGAAFNRDHTTVIHACEKIANDAKDGAGISHLLEDIRRAVRGK